MTQSPAYTHHQTVICLPLRFFTWAKEAGFDGVAIVDTITFIAAASDAKETGRELTDTAYLPFGQPDMDMLIILQQVVAKLLEEGSCEPPSAIQWRRQMVGILKGFETFSAARSVMPSFHELNVDSPGFSSPTFSLPGSFSVPSSPSSPSPSRTPYPGTNSRLAHRFQDHSRAPSPAPSLSFPPGGTPLRAGIATPSARTALASPAPVTPSARTAFASPAPVTPSARTAFASPTPVTSLIHGQRGTRLFPTTPIMTPPASLPAYTQSLTRYEPPVYTSAPDSDDRLPAPSTFHVPQSGANDGRDDPLAMPYYRNRPPCFPSHVYVSSFYVVTAGAKVGIFRDWDSANQVVSGFRNNRHRAYTTWSQAADAFNTAFYAGQVCDIPV